MLKCVEVFMIIKKNDCGSLEIAKDILKKGGIVILPTDTVYGFSGLVDSTDFFQKTDEVINLIKKSPENKPLIQLISKPEDIKKYTDEEIPIEILKKWPGALTIIVKIKQNAPKYEELPSVAFRCPGDEWLRNLIEECESPIFSTSVNRSGNPVLDEISAIKNEFSKEVDLIIDDGDKKNALPSTLISLENGKIKILRQGSVKIE